MKRKISYLLLISTTIYLSCDKDWLAAKRDISTVVPATLQDYRAILNAVSLPALADSYTSAVLTSGEEVIVTPTVFNNGTETDRNLYSWQAKPFPAQATAISDWDDSYAQVFNCNVVLDGLSSFERTHANAVEWDDVKGGALFFRAKAFYNLAQAFAQPYNDDADTNPYGIPLRLTSDPNAKTQRANVGETYRQIVADLKNAIPLLTTQPFIKTDASRQAAYALLARCLLSIQDYSNAFLYADSALQLYDRLLDFNDLVPASGIFPIPAFNDETLFYSYFFTTPTFLIFINSQVSDELVAMYDDYDLRRQLFFSATGGFVGNYTASPRIFNGLAADELYLIRAECHARSGRMSMALDDLNYLLKHRIMTSYFKPFTLENTPDILGKVLEERRKELLFRGLRWADLRRLNQEENSGVTLVRVVGDNTFVLQPASNFYTLPIPDYIINQTNIQQNPRN